MSDAMSQAIQAIRQLDPGIFDIWTVQEIVPEDYQEDAVPLIGITASRHGWFSAIAVTPEAAKDAQLVVDRCVPKMDYAIRQAENKTVVVAQ